MYCCQCKFAAQLTTIAYLRMNIAIIENHLISTNTVRRKLTQTLMEVGHKVTVLSTGTEADKAFSASLGFEVIDVGTSNTNPAEVLGYIKKIRAALKAVDAQLCLTFTMRPAIWGNMVSRTLGIPVITNITGIGPLAHSNSMAYRVARKLYRTALSKTKVVFFQNIDDRKIFEQKKFVRKSQAEIIPGSGVDVDHFLPQPHQNSNGNFVFLFISRLIKDKGILEYVSAATELKKRYPHVKCQVIGPYYNQNLKDNIISENQILGWHNEGSLEYLGAANDVRPFIAASDCIVLPSYREGMSNVLLEAASMQKPAIAANVTGCKEIIEAGKTGFLCKVKDAGDLLHFMEKMLHLSPEERADMGVAARERVKTYFDKRIVIAAYVRHINVLSAAISAQQ